jgi:hypothetical protein
MNTRPKSTASRREVTGKGKLKIKDLGLDQAATKNLSPRKGDAVKGGRTPVDHTIEVP